MAKKNILYINSCVREDSRTDTLARAALNKLGGSITELKIEKERIQPLDSKTLIKRDKLIENGSYSDEMFKYARQFAEADIIVISAPYWDLSFPSMLKVYFEAVSVLGIAFRYTDEGVPVGLCRATELIYITTAGGHIGDFDFGYDYVRALAQNLYGISNVKRFKAEGLDIYGADIDEIMIKAQSAIY